jgi:hypothetical protein
VTGCGALRGDLAAYAVGSLDAQTRAAFEAHLDACGPCRRELEELRGVTGFLAALTPEEAERGPVRDDGAILDRLLARVAGERRRHRRVRWLAAAAAAVLLVGGVLGGWAIARDDPSPQERTVATASGQGDGGVRIDLALEDRAWGTALTIEVANVSPGHTCSLVAISGDGIRETAATWTVPSGGYRGEEPGKRSLTLDGAVGLSVAQIERFEVVTPEGEKLVDFPLASAASTD